MGNNDFWVEECRCHISKGHELDLFHLLGIILEVYIDDIVVNSDAFDSHLDDLCLAFERMKKYGLKMNPLKCAFGVSSCKFLGFIIHEDGIEIDPKKIEAIQKVEAPT